MAAAAAAYPDCPIFEKINEKMIDIITPDKKYLIVDNENITLYELESLFEILENNNTICKGRLIAEFNANFTVYSILKCVLKYIKFYAGIGDALSSVNYISSDNISLENKDLNFNFKANGNTVFTINQSKLFDATILAKLLHFVMFINPESPNHQHIIKTMQKLGVDYVLDSIFELKKKPGYFTFIDPRRNQFLSPTQAAGRYRKKVNKSRKSINKKKKNKTKGTKTQKHNKKQ